MGDSNEDRYVMKSIEGKFVTVKKTRDGLKLCVVEQQNEIDAPCVYISTRQKNQMALRFRHENNDYIPKVDGNKLKLETSYDNTDLPDSHWFEKYNRGASEHYGLRSVAEPSQYLSINCNRLTQYIILCEDSDACVLVTDKKEVEASTSKSASPSTT